MACRSAVHCMDAPVRLPNAGTPLPRQRQRPADKTYNQRAFRRMPYNPTQMPTVTAIMIQYE